MAIGFIWLSSREKMAATTAGDTLGPVPEAAPMSRTPSAKHALRQAAMWQRLADQCQRSGDHDLEADARMLASRHLQSAYTHVVRAAGDEDPLAAMRRQLDTTNG